MKTQRSIRNIGEHSVAYQKPLVVWQLHTSQLIFLQISTTKAEMYITAQTSNERARIEALCLWLHFVTC